MTGSMHDPRLEVGALVRHRAEPDWGVGQVQSILGPRVTVMFEHRGKVVLDGYGVPIEVVAPDPA